MKSDLHFFREPKNILVVYLALLVLHFVISRYAKIYPSLVFPAFSEAPKMKNSVPIGVVNCYAVLENGKYIQLVKEDFFHNLYYKHVNYFLDVVMKNEKKSINNSSLQIEREAFRKYAKGSLARMYPRLKFNKLLIEKGNKNYNIAEKKLDVKLSNINSVSLPL